MNSLTHEERFWAKVDTSGSCWEWTGSRQVAGYGVMSAAKKHIRAHRVSYELANGPIPAGLLIDHICQNKGCVNPAHLRLATQKQNLENHSGAQANSKSGVRGVSWHKTSGRWQALVCHNGKRYAVGTFDTIPEAEAAVIAKRNELFTHNNQDRAV